MAFDNSYSRLPHNFYARLSPEAVKRPHLEFMNDEVLGLLGWDRGDREEEEWAKVWGGNCLLEGMDPIALVYAGHQFGTFVPRLGDGRALLLGEVVGEDGVRRDIQLKGSGRTPFSRDGDGRSPLGPVLREYVVSEAMYCLGIPTTRSLACVSSGESVYREEVLAGGVLCRVARGHVRVGTCEYFSARGEVDLLGTLVNYTCNRLGLEAREGEPLWIALLRDVCEKQAKLVARWMLVGFIHGVMNTDNTSLFGETIDYGPCAFLDEYDSRKVLSFIDRGGRYAYGAQPGVISWNMARFAESLYVLGGGGGKEELVERVNGVMTFFAETFYESYRDGLRKKLGLGVEGEGDEVLCGDLWVMMEESGSDFTMTFRDLSGVRLDDAISEGVFLGHFGKDVERARSWLGRWKERVRGGMACEERMRRMRGVNPLYIARNHKVEEALKCFELGDVSVFKGLLEAVSRPYEERDGYDAFAKPPRVEERVQATFCGT